MYSKANREWHVIVEDGQLAKLFEKYIKHDRDDSEAEAEAGRTGVELDWKRCRGCRTCSFRSIRFSTPPSSPTRRRPSRPKSCRPTPRDFDVMPVLTPDNYIGRIRKLIDGAKRSIYLQYAYITYSDKEIDKDFTAMLVSLADLSNRPNFDVRIIVGSAGAADKIRMLVEAGFKETVFRTQGNIHNKGIVVDGETVLVSSANWSGDGVLRNRDAGLIIHDKDIADLLPERLLVRLGEQGQRVHRGRSAGHDRAPKARNAARHGPDVMARLLRLSGMAARSGSSLSVDDRNDQRPRKDDQHREQRFPDAVFQAEENLRPGEGIAERVDPDKKGCRRDPDRRPFRLYVLFGVARCPGTDDDDRDETEQRPADPVGVLADEPRRGLAAAAGGNPACIPDFPAR